MTQKFLVNGSFGHKNVGDEAILQAIVELINSKYDAEIAVTSYDPEWTAEKFDVQEIIPPYHKDKVAWKEEARDSDYILIGGGGLIESNNILNWSEIAIFCDKRSIPLVFVGVGVTPPETEYHKILYKYTLKAAEEVFVRDSRSREILSEMNVSSTKVPDLAFNLSSIERESKNNLVFVLREVDWLDTDWETLANVIEKVNSKVEGEVILALFQDREKDRELVDKIVDQIDFSPKVAVEEDFRKAKIMLSKSRTVVSVRLHGSVLSANAGTPFVSLAYNPKCENVLDDYEESQVMWIDNIQPEVLEEKILGAWEAESIKSRSREKAEKIQNMNLTPEVKDAYLKTRFLRTLIYLRQLYLRAPLNLKIFSRALRTTYGDRKRD
jgi:polysaccharide pyruvyl transferase CsaB